jgi:hypothetical protein
MAVVLLNHIPISDLAVIGSRPVVIVPYAGNDSASGTERFEQQLLSSLPDECGPFLKPASAPTSAVNLSIPICALFGISA